MADGTTTPISQVQAGDEILAFDAATGRNVPGQVVETFTHEDVAVLELETSAGRVETTATHPFYVEGKGYTPAQDLRAGDLLHTPTGQQVIVEQLSYTGQRTTVHNLHIKNYNNYHVHTNTGTPVLVHNNGTDKCGDALAPLPDNPAGEIQQIAREEAAKGRQAWLNSLSPRQLAAIKESGAYWRAPMFIGTAIHETVAKRLEREFGRDVFKYNRVGPDFSYVDAAGNTKYVELTTPGQVASHKRRPDPRYASADYATYDMPQ